MEASERFIFVREKMKPSAKVCSDSILEPIGNPLKVNLFIGNDWIFQQDSAPALKPKMTQQEIESDFIKHKDWPTSIPDLNSLVSILCDETHFWFNGYVNKQNCRIRSEANSQVYVETPLHPEKLTVWCALWAGGILLQKR
ncbi:hypothetical protein TNCV_3860651 [Trichonephila clavipes]|nr:hypothetical protein TNCV_3860651 [Trichonephila clavipes]